MQITETVADGLKRQLKVIIPADEIKNRLNTKLEDIKSKVRLNGFRPGKVPMERVRQLYGKSVMAEVLEQTVGETSAKALQERQERPAFQPDIKLPEDQEVVTRMVDGLADLEYTMSFEILPKIKLVELKTITLEKEVAEPAQEDVETSLKRLADANVSYTAKEGAAENGDRLTVDYLGRVDGEAFEGGAGEDAFIILGSNRFIPGFEEGLVGAKSDSKQEVKVTFPADYQATHLAGKDAVFDVTVKEIAAPVDTKIDDDFAKTLGLDTLSKLEDAIRGQLQKELDSASHNKLKKALLDELDKRHEFDVPATLVDSEFDGIWRAVTRQLEKSKSTFEAEGTTEETSRENYHKMADRRVRLGLVLSEIGNENQIKVNDDELRRAMIDRARQFPGQEKMVLEFYKKNPNAINELRAPVYEEKVINFILELVKLEEKKISAKELLESAAQQERDDSLFADSDEHDHGHDHSHDHHHDHVHDENCNHDHDH